MGLILPQTVKVRTNSMTYKYYKEKGYKFEKCGDFIEVDIFDLPKGSSQMVKIVCDICGKESEMWYRTVVNCNEKNELITCRSNSCKHKKYEDTCTKKYGVKHPMQCKEIQDKVKDTNLGRYGAECPFGSKEIQNKSKKTWQENYGEGIINPFQVESVREKSIETWQKNYGEGIINPGQAQVVKDKIKATWKNNYGENIENPFQVESIREKFKQTMLNNYGVEYAMQNKEIQDKAKDTNLERYGVEYPMQSQEIKNKVLDSFQFNHTGPSSRAQRYINHILNGTLNKRICGSLADIYIEKENIVIEHDGGGHFLGDIMNGSRIPIKESLLYEKEREDKIINNGYRMIRFIATKDRIPSDEVILNLVEGFKNSDFKIIRINFEEGTIDRDYDEKWYCNFGGLRRITKEDLEKFEKQKENISEN